MNLGANSSVAMMWKPHCGGDSTINDLFSTTTNNANTDTTTSKRLYMILTFLKGIILTFGIVKIYNDMYPK